MEKALLTILIICLLTCSFVSCNKETDTTSISDITTESTEVSEIKEELAVDSVLELFENDYNAQKYTSEQIGYIISNLEKNGIVLSGSVTAIVHLTRKASEPGRSDWSWAYVYEFTEEADAIAFEENRRGFVEATEENGACVRCGLIVVFGSAPIIASVG